LWKLCRARHKFQRCALNTNSSGSGATRSALCQDQTRSSNSNSQSSNSLYLLGPSAHRPTTGLPLHVLQTVVTTVVRPWFGRTQPPTSHVSAMFPADRADARGWRTFVPSEPCTHVHGHGLQALSRRWCSARSLEKTIADRNGDHFTETHVFQPGPHLAEKVVPSPTVTDTIPPARAVGWTRKTLPIRGGARLDTTKSVSAYRAA
jgi:hypothetical protein